MQMNGSPLDCDVMFSFHNAEAAKISNNSKGGLAISFSPSELRY